MERHRPKNLIAAVRKVLWVTWDPIGVNQFDEANDEYDAYAPGLAALLTSGCDRYKLRQRLAHHETVDMGLFAASPSIDAAVDELLALRDSSIDSQSNRIPG